MCALEEKEEDGNIHNHTHTHIHTQVLVYPSLCSSRGTWTTHTRTSIVWEKRKIDPLLPVRNFQGDPLGKVPRHGPTVTSNVR